MDFLFGFFAGLLALDLWWLAFFAVYAAFEILCVHNDEPGQATLSSLLFLSAGLVIAYVWYGVNPGHALWVSLPYLALGLPIYLAIGGLWSLFKWYRFLLKARKEFQEALASWEKRTSAQAGERDPVYYTKPIRPRESFASQNKGRIIGWITYWPFSMIGMLLGDFLTWVFRSVYEALSEVYERMGNRVFKDFE